jgi:putative radical SAM enzyme (TIGR03279 family)
LKILEVMMTALAVGFQSERARTSTPGVTVRAVVPGSPAEKAGLKPDDVITQVDDQPIGDFLDFYIAAFGRAYTLTVKRGNRHRDLRLERRHLEDTGLEMHTGRPIACSNRCVFCFVDQLPKGLRKELYIKDEDYRLSFLHGNYLTLTNLTAQDESRIVRLHLSPLYASVHATDEAARAKLLGRQPEAPVLDVIDRLGEGGIRLHAQVVVVPKFNDGAVLEQTLQDLARRHDTILSLSVVPVGLTGHRAGLPLLEAVSSPQAARIVDDVRRLNCKMRGRIGRGFVYASDEMMLAAGGEIPTASYYDDFPQIENGVGLLRRFIDSSADASIPASLQGRRLAFVTGRLAAPFVDEVAARLVRQGAMVDVVVIDNSLLGRSVTVSGLLAGQDILRAIGRMDALDAVVLPPNVINESGVTLDDMTAEGMSEGAGVPFIVGDYDMGETLEAIDAVFSGKHKV